MNRKLAGLAAIGLLVSGCATTATQGHNGSLPSCPSGEPRIQETSNGPWVCDPDGPVTPSPTVQQSTQDDPSFTCQTGYVNIPPGPVIYGTAPSGSATFQTTEPVVDTADSYSLADYAAMEISITANQTVQVTSVDVVWYTSAGQELSSNTFNIDQLITVGQTLPFVFDQTSDPAPPSDAASCSIVTWE